MSCASHIRIDLAKLNCRKRNLNKSFKKAFSSSQTEWIYVNEYVHFSCQCVWFTFVTSRHQKSWMNTQNLLTVFIWKITIQPNNQNNRNNNEFSSISILSSILTCMLWLWLCYVLFKYSIHIFIIIVIISVKNTKCYMYNVPSLYGLNTISFSIRLFPSFTSHARFLLLLPLVVLSLLYSIYASDIEQ